MKSQLEEEGKKKGPIRCDIDVIVSYKKKLEKSKEIKNVPNSFIDKINEEIKVINQFLPQELTFDKAIEWAKNSGLSKKEDIIIYIKNKAKQSNLVCPGRIAFLAAQKILEK